MDPLQDPSSSAGQQPPTALSGDPNAAMAPPAAPAAPAAPPAKSGGLWKDVLVGALAGLGGSKGATSFGAGLAGGVQGEQQAQQQKIVNEQNKQELQSKIKWQSVQAAHMAAEDANAIKGLENQTKSIQLQHDKLSQDTLQLMLANGYELAGETNTSGPEGEQKLQAFAEGHDEKGVPPYMNISLGDGRVAHLKPQNNDAALKVINTAAAINLEEPMTPEQFRKLTPEQKIKVQNDARNELSPTKDFTSVETLKNAYFDSESKLNALTKNKNTTPDILQRATTKRDVLKDSYDQATKEEKRLADEKLAGQLKVAQARAAIKGDVFQGTTPDGQEITGTKEELLDAGVKEGEIKMSSGALDKVGIARQLTSRTGLFAQSEQALAAFKPGELEALAPRWNEFLAGKVGTADPRYVALRTKINGLLSTALMQAHVGSRGGEAIMEHFQDLADTGKMSAATLRAALKAEKEYVTEKAMRLPSEQKKLDDQSGTKDFGFKPLKGQ